MSIQKDFGAQSDKYHLSLKRYWVRSVLINTIFEKMIHRSDTNSVEAENQYEFCPRCNANLTLQKGYNNQLPYWVCRGCGEMLINPEIDDEDNIAWICDQCGTMLNIQPGFRDNNGEWKCTECGFVNIIDQSQIYSSEDEYQAEMQNPYRGLSDEDSLKLSFYQEEEFICGRNDIILVRHHESGIPYIKKLLGIYDKSIYTFLKDYPVEHMPRIIEMFESENCLIVIEEYIEGRTVAELLEEGTFSEEKAVNISKSICNILEVLHNLPKPIVHRDIKPSNLMIDKAGEVILLDMNVAKWYDPDKSGDTRYMGTREYAAPEQVGYGLKASSAKSDIYAVGILLNVMITGQYPRDKRADGEIWKIIKRCISLEANDRYTASELKSELAGWEERHYAG